MPGWRSLIGLLCAGWLLAIAALVPDAHATGLDRPSSIAAPPSDQPATADLQSVEMTVGKGDTLFSMLGRAGVKAAERIAVVDTLEILFDPRTLRPKDKIRLILQSRDNGLVVRSLILDLNGRENLAVDMAGAANRDSDIEQIAFAPPLKRTEISSPFGWRIHPVFGDRRFHKGIDLRAPKGTPVSASADGVVVDVGWRGNYGKYIRVRHNTTVETTYSHLSGYAPGLHGGQRVRQGQVIGYVGRTGVATGNHLYYEMLINGKHVDPLRPPRLVPIQGEGNRLIALKSLIRTGKLN